MLFQRKKPLDLILETAAKRSLTRQLNAFDLTMRTLLLDRREDYPQPRRDTVASGHPRVESFAEIDSAALSDAS